MLNPMVLSDLVTYRGVTIVILFLRATNAIEYYQTVIIKCIVHFAIVIVKITFITIFYDGTDQLSNSRFSSSNQINPKSCI